MRRERAGSVASFFLRPRRVFCYTLVAFAQGGVALAVVVMLLLPLPSKQLLTVDRIASCRYI